jgi:hypothetical protein
MIACRYDISAILAEQVITRLKHCDDEAAMDEFVRFMTREVGPSQLTGLVRVVRDEIARESAPARVSLLRYARVGLYRLLTDRSEPIRRSAQELIQAMFSIVSRKGAPAAVLSRASEAEMTQLLADGLQFFAEVTNRSEYIEDIPPDLIDASRFHFVVFLRVLRSLLLGTRAMTSDNFEKVLQIFWRLHHVQTTALDFNVCQAISVLTRFDSAFLKPHFQAIYTTVMDRTDANPMRAFSKFRRYLPFSDIGDLYTIIQHKSFPAINKLVVRSPHSPSCSALLQSLYQFPNDPVCRPIITSLVGPVESRFQKSTAKARITLLKAGLLHPDLHESEAYLEFFVSACSVTTKARSTKTTEEGVENFETALDLATFLFTSPESRARIDPFDDIFYRLAIKYCDGPPSVQIRIAMRTFFIELCHDHGSEMRNLLTTSIQEQIAAPPMTPDWDKYDLIYILFALLIDCGEGVATSLLCVVDKFDTPLRDFNWIAVVDELVSGGTMLDWVAAFWSGYGQSHTYGMGVRDAEFSELALTAATFEQALTVLQCQFCQKIPYTVPEWRITAAIFSRFREHYAELRKVFPLQGRPFRSDATTGPYIDIVFPVD